MLSEERNRLLCETGPGTPMGELLRRYWHPVAGAAELDAQPVKAVRVMGEDLVLYRDKSGRIVANWPGYVREYEAAVRVLNPADFRLIPAPARVPERVPVAA